MSNAQGSLFGAEVFAEYNQPLYSASRVMLDSGSSNWCSPDTILKPVREFAGGEIVFDPFSNPYSIVRALRAMMLARPDGSPEVPLPPGMEIGNSIEIDWPTGGTIYDNPPFGDEIEPCAYKIRQQYERGCEIVSCVPARIDTEWFQEGLRPPMHCAWRGRVKFLEMVSELERRWEERVAKAKAAHMKPPSKPKYRRVGPYLAESDPAPFALILAYHGKRFERFINVFSSYGRIYTEGLRA